MFSLQLLIRKNNKAVLIVVLLVCAYLLGHFVPIKSKAKQDWCTQENFSGKYYVIKDESDEFNISSIDLIACNPAERTSKLFLW